ncbi:hypothetical protein V8C42DRAFT_194927 [Trichoderma barbatum]
MAEVDHFLADVDVFAEGGVQGSDIGPHVQDEARKKQKLDGASFVQPSLLDSAPEMGNRQDSAPGIMSDIQFGVSRKSIHNDVSYGPIIHDLFNARDNLWVQKAKRPTALEMWDIADDAASRDADQA